MSPNFFPGCEAAAVGIESIRCMNEATGFILGWGLITMLLLIFWFNLELEPIKDRLAVISFALAVVSMLLIASGFLPDDAFIYFFLAIIGSAAALMFRR